MHATQTAGARLAAFDANDSDLSARLTWLVAANAEADRRARRRPREEEEALMMRRPITTGRAFARFGLLLGTLPPAAIFARLIFTLHIVGAFGVIFIPMLLICAFLGRRMGAHVSRQFTGHCSWEEMFESALIAAFIWATATGAAGGALFFGVGALFGFGCALVVALPAFALFAMFHRLLMRDGMIDARQLSPLAWGISAAIAALILSPNIIPY
jgi:hypothetical protein